MHYPGVILTRHIRIFIMLSLVVSFFVLSPILILYTAGYTFNFSNFHIEQTGVMSIDVTQDDAKVYLNNVFIDAKLPIRLANYLPGIYNLRIQKEGYYDWVQDIRVESKKTTYIKSIFLYKKGTPKKILSVKKNTKPFFSHDAQFVALLQNNTDGYSVSLINLIDNSEVNVFHSATSSPPQIVWSPQTNLLVIASPKDTTQNIIVYNPINKVTYTTEVLHPSFIFQWDTKNVNRIYVQEGEHVNAIEFGREPHFFIAKTHSPFWYVDSSQKVWMHSPSGEKKISLVDTAGRTLSFQLAETIDKIVDVNENFLLGIHDDKALLFFKENNTSFVLNKSFKFSGFFYSPKQSHSIFWSPWEIYSVDSSGKIDLLNRSSESIDHVFLLHESNSLLIKNKKSLIAFNPGYNTQQEILTHTNMDVMALNEKTHSIFFSSSNGIYMLPF